jgi:hypothetical protein
MADMPRNPKRHSDEKIMEALDIHRGNVCRAAKALGYHHSSLRKRISKTPELQEYLTKVREANLDLAESLLWKHIEEKENLQALLEYLKAQGKKRGYGNQSIDMTMDAKVQHKLDENILKGLMDKFEKELDDE